MENDEIKTDISGKWVSIDVVVSVMEALRALEQQLADANRRIAELEKSMDELSSIWSKWKNRL